MSFKYTLQVINDIVLEEYVNQYSCCYNTQCIHFKPLGEQKKEDFPSIIWVKFIYVHTTRKTPPSG